jgi:hypothetical protein
MHGRLPPDCSASPVALCPGRLRLPFCAGGGGVGSQRCAPRLRLPVGELGICGWVHAAQLALLFVLPSSCCGEGALSVSALAPLLLPATSL